MSISSKDISNFVLVDSTGSVSIDSVEGSEWRVVVVSLKFTFESFKSSLKINFSSDDRSDGLLDVSWERVVSSNSTGWSVEGTVSKEVILAWKEHLEELLEAEFTVTIAIKEVYKLISLRLTNMINLLISQEVDEFSA